jgi:hypothetical protein
MKTKRTIYIIILVTCLTSISVCQNTLHLIDTLIGEKVGDEFANVEGVGDVNGDGYKDFIVSSIGGQYTKLYLGGKPFNTSAAYRFTTPQVVGIGDVNGDGYDDLLVAFGTYIDYGAYEDIKVYVCFGGKTLPFDSLLVFHKVYPQPCGVVLATLGDINGDGYADFAISNSTEGDGIGRCYIYMGGKTLSTTPIATLTDGTVYSFFGYSVCGIGDINKDGYADFAISAPRLNTADTSKLRIYCGGVQFDTVPKYIFKGNPKIGFQIANVGDVNGDGYNDFILSPPYIGLYLHPDSIVIIRNGSEIGMGGDVNNDGYSDFIVGTDEYVNSQGIMTGAASVYFGGPVIDTVPKVVLIGEHKWDQFGYYVSVLGDINGDGYSEIAVGAPYYPDYNNPLGKVYIYSFAPTDGVKEFNGEIILPHQIRLFQNYPNPFNPNTVINYQLPEKSHVYLRVYNMLGRGIKTLIDGEQKAGVHNVNFNGSWLSSGVYFYRLTAGNIVAQKTMVLVK